MSIRWISLYCLSWTTYRTTTILTINTRDDTVTTICRTGCIISNCNIAAFEITSCRWTSDVCNNILSSINTIDLCITNNGIWEPNISLTTYTIDNWWSFRGERERNSNTFIILYNLLKVWLQNEA